MRRLTRRGALLALGALPIASRARAHGVPIGRWVQIPHGVDPAHPEAMELGAARAGRSAVRIPASAPSLAWEREALGERERRGSRARAPIVSADRVIHVATPSGLATFGLDGGEGRRVEIGPIDASPALLPGGDVLAITRAGRALRIGPGGEVRAEAELGAGVTAPPLVLDDGSALVAGTDRTLRRLDAELRERWVIALDHAAQRAPARDGDRALVAVGAELVEVDFQGSIVRRTALGARAVTSPARADDGTVWISLANGDLLALDRARRERARIAVGPGQLDDEAPAIAPDGSVRIAARTALRAIGRGGEARWEVHAGAAIDFPVRVDPDGATLLVDRGPKLVAFEADGSERWRVTLSSHSMTAPVVTVRGEIVVVGVQGRVIVLR